MKERKITYGWIAVALAIFAGALTIALTGVAFWLSYEHLHDVAGAHGLPATSPRAWAWPATLDTFIVIGEVLILRSSLLGKTDWWAICLAAAGSGGSITLNVVGVGSGAGALDYTVAAVPPVAALLAFGALMRQLHGMIKAYLSETPKPVSRSETEPEVQASQPGVPVPQRPSQPPSQAVPVSLAKAVPPPVSLTHPSRRPTWAVPSGTAGQPQRVPVRKPRASQGLVPPAPEPSVDNLTTSQAAGLAGVPASTIRTWRSRGKGGRKLEPVVSDPDVLYARDDVIKFLEATK